MTQDIKEPTVEEALRELRETLPLGRIEIRADMTESGQTHVTILNGFLPLVPYGPTLNEAMGHFRKWKESQ